MEIPNHRVERNVGTFIGFCRNEIEQLTPNIGLEDNR